MNYAVFFLSNVLRAIEFNKKWFSFNITLKHRFLLSYTCKSALFVLSLKLCSNLFLNCFLLSWSVNMCGSSKHEILMNRVVV